MIEFNSEEIFLLPFIMALIKAFFSSFYSYIYFYEKKIFGVLIVTKSFKGINSLNLMETNF